MQDEAFWRTRLNRWRLLAGEMAIFIQELGCPAGFGDDGAGAPPRPATGINASPEQQARFFAFMAREFATDPQLRAATTFQLFDFAPETAAFFGDLVRNEGAVEAGNNFEEALATLGLCRWADTTCRPAWDVWLEGLQALMAAHMALE